MSAPLSTVGAWLAADRKAIAACLAPLPWRDHWPVASAWLRSHGLSIVTGAPSLNTGLLGRPWRPSVARRLRDEGFNFRFPDLAPALTDLYRRRTSNQA